MTGSNVVKFPYHPRASARKPRRSKNGTPEERAAKAGAIAANLKVANIIELSGGPTASELEAHAQWLEIGKIIDQLDQRSLPVVVAFLRQLLRDTA